MRQAATTRAQIEEIAEIVAVIADALEERFPDMTGHSRRVANLARMTAEELGLPESISSRCYLGALLHDLGKLFVPEQILSKPGPLERDEWVRIKQHASLGARMVARMRPLRHLEDVVLLHHERIDGSGYPQGLRNGEIPVEALILGVVDSYDAMTTARSYRTRAKTPAEALEEIQRLSGRWYDPDVVRAFTRVLTRCNVDLMTFRQLVQGDHRGRLRRR